MFQYILHCSLKKNKEIYSYLKKSIILAEGVYILILITYKKLYLGSANVNVNKKFPSNFDK